METICVSDKQFGLYIEEEKIQRAIVSIANAINKDSGGNDTLFISVLNGSFMFTADLLKLVNGNAEVHFVKLSSYSGTASTGNVNQLIGLDCSLTGRNVVILEDIVDTGNTLEKIHEIIQQENPRQVKVAALFLKPSVYKKNITVDYIGMEIEDVFIVGYGLDYNSLGRNLRSVYKLIE